MNHNSNLESCLENIHFLDYLLITTLCQIKMNFLSWHLISFLSVYLPKGDKCELLMINAMQLCLSIGYGENETKSEALLPDIQIPSQAIFMVLFILLPLPQLPWLESLRDSHCSLYDPLSSAVISSQEPSPGNGTCSFPLRCSQSLRAISNFYPKLLYTRRSFRAQFKYQL